VLQQICLNNIHTMCLLVYPFIVYWLWRFQVWFRQHYYKIDWP